MMKRHGRAALAAIVTAATISALACSDDATGPSRPGTVVVSLITPSADDGAILITVTGRGLTEARAAGSGSAVYWRLHSDRELRAAIFGNLVSGPLITVGTDDSRSVTATIVEVASRGDILRESTSGYGLRVTSSAGP